MCLDTMSKQTNNRSVSATDNYEEEGDVSSWRIPKGGQRGGRSELDRKKFHCRAQDARWAKMRRTRLLFFTLGFATAGAGISHFVWRDLLAARHSTSSQVKDKFGSLEPRVSNLEAMLSETTQTVQDDG